MIEEKIIVRLHALNWTMGEFAFFDITLLDEGKLTVDWGDGRTSKHFTRYKGERLRVEHDYGKKAKIIEENFVITIECHETTIRTFHKGCIDMEIDGIDFSCSPSIEELNTSWLGDIDFSPIVKLKHLVCDGTYAKTLDLRNNTNLETLDCSYSNVQRLLLSKCNNLQEIDCKGCRKLQSITLSNYSQLRMITVSADHNIKPNSWKYVQEIIEINHGEINFV